jgi:hypothetical protein
MFWQIAAGALFIIAFVFGTGVAIIKISDWISDVWFNYRTREAFKWGQKHLGEEYEYADEEDYYDDE